ncbi:hypothetical protein ACYPKM_01025 [Pseudomonas aeruginosa]
MLRYDDSAPIAKRSRFVEIKNKASQCLAALTDPIQRFVRSLVLAPGFTTAIIGWLSLTVLCAAASIGYLILVRGAKRVRELGNGKNHDQIPIKKEE